MIRKFLFISAAALFFGCDNNTAVMWTDKAEFAFYAQLYNYKQSKYKIEVHFVESAAKRLTETKDYPDIVVASFLESPRVISSFLPLNNLFGKNSVAKNSFYPALLEDGSVKKKQLLLPVSFNIPAIVFDNSNSNLLSNYLVCDLDEAKNLGAAFNQKSNNNDWVRKGFSPLWGKNRGCMFATARLFRVGFTEVFNKKAKKTVGLKWNHDELDAAVLYMKDWIENINGGVQAEEDFIYSYFFNPETKLITERRILFAYMNSDKYFNLQDDMDYRWLSRDNGIPILDGITSLGIHKKSRSKNVAQDFAVWFFNSDTQDMILSESRDNHLNETIFGIAGGFSAMQSVNEFVFPKYYNKLLGHLPPADYLYAPNVLPASWTEIKDAVVIPYILNIILKTDKNEQTLDERFSAWQSIKRNTF